MQSEFDAGVADKLRLFAEQTSDFVGVGDPWGRILYLNPAACKRLGVADYSDLTLADLFPAEAFAYYYEVVRPALLRTGAWSGEVLVNAAGIGAVPMYVSTTAEIGPGGETNGGVVFACELPGPTPVALADDAGEVGEVGGPLAWPAFEEQVRVALASVSRGGACALVVVSVDTTEAIERFGALTAPSVVRALAGRIARVARAFDVVGLDEDRRLGLLLRGIRSHNEASRIAGNVYECLVDGPVTTPGGQIAPPIDCGVAIAKPGEGLADLIRRASAPIWPGAAPEASIGAPTTITDRAAGPATMDEFRVAMSHGDVRPYAQPVVDVTTGLVVGYRGFARWCHARLGALDADAFVPMIAETPLANQVDLYVARETAAMLTVAAREGSPLRLYAAVSRRLVADVRTEQYLWEIADAFSLRMQQICLQVARPLLDDWTPALRDALQSLGDAGVTLVVTDVEDPLDVPRVADQGFRELHLAHHLAAAGTDPPAPRVVAEIVREAHDRDLLVAATGVDEPRQRDALADAGADLATGDLYGEPRPTDTIE